MKVLSACVWDRHAAPECQRQHVSYSGHSSADKTPVAPLCDLRYRWSNAERLPIISFSFSAANNFTWLLRLRFSMFVSAVS